MNGEVDVIAVLGDIWHRGLCSENVHDFEAAKSAVDELIEVLKLGIKWSSELAFQFEGRQIHDDVSEDLATMRAALSRLTGAA